MRPAADNTDEEDDADDDADAVREDGRMAK
jgi:hypothetical protein